MGRFYCEDEGDQPYALWKANLDRAIKGRKGQAFLRYLKRGLEALPKPELIEEGFYHRRTAEDLDPQGATVMPDGYAEEEACALGAALRLRVIETGEAVKYVYRNRATGSVVRHTITSLEDLATDWSSDEEGYEHAEWAAHTFGIPSSLAWHIGWLNDEMWEGLEDGERYQRMMEWIDERILPEPVAA